MHGDAQHAAASNRWKATTEGKAWMRSTIHRPRRTEVKRSGSEPVNQFEMRSFLYFFKPPFPSDGGYAAASAGRSGPVGPSVGHVRGVCAGAPSRLHSRPERQPAHADALAFSDGARGLPLDQVHCRCFVAWRTVVRGQGPKRIHEAKAISFRSGSLDL